MAKSAVVYSLAAVCLAAALGATDRIAGHHAWQIALSGLMVGAWTLLAVVRESIADLLVTWSLVLSWLPVHVYAAVGDPRLESYKQVGLAVARHARGDARHWCGWSVATHAGATRHGERSAPLQRTRKESSHVNA